MKYVLSMILFLAAGAMIAYDQYDLEYWMTPPEKRADDKWKFEVDKMVRNSKKLQTAIFLIKSIEMTTTDQQFKELIDKSHPPFKKANKGKYDLKLQFMPWMEDMKYGYLIQHEFFDENNNKVIEFTSNVEIGKLW